MNKEIHSGLAVVLDRGRQTYGKVREKLIKGAEVTNEAVHNHPYRVGGIGLGLGALLGYLIAHRRHNHQ